MFPKEKISFILFTVSSRNPKKQNTRRCYKNTLRLHKKYIFCRKKIFLNRWNGGIVVGERWRLPDALTLWPTINGKERVVTTLYAPRLVGCKIWQDTNTRRIEIKNHPIISSSPLYLFFLNIKNLTHSLTCPESRKKCLYETIKKSQEGKTPQDDARN